VFARGSDNALWHIAETSPGGGWSAWTSLKITITATAPGTIGAVKTLTIRSRRAPAVKTRCLPPGSTRPAAC
jgi:hypothetical protein